MKAVKSLATITSFFVISASAQASNTLVQEAGSEMGSMLLMSAGVIGLVAARKHMKASN